VNIVTGAGRPGRRWSRHPGIDKIAFTGSTEVGKRDRQEAVAALQEAHARARRQVAEHHLRGRRIDQALEGVIMGIYFNQGQVCCAGSRLFVQESIK
jgi:aldehyde dehydrogenase (NAD+)